MSSSPDAVAGEEYEYELAHDFRPDKQVVDPVFSRYEALPPNYGLAHNMLAGAFAGIAVCTEMPLHELRRRY